MLAANATMIPVPLVSIQGIPSSTSFVPVASGNDNSFKATLEIYKITFFVRNGRTSEFSAIQSDKFGADFHDGRYRDGFL